MDPATRACSTKVAPVTGEISSLHSYIEVCFFPVETAAPTLTSDGPKKNLWLFAVVRKLHMKFERTRLLKDGSKSNELLQVQKVAVVAT